MISARTRERRREDSTDAMIVAAVLAMIMLNVLLAPFLQNSSAALLDHLMVAGSVGAVVILAAVVVRISFGPGVRNEL